MTVYDESATLHKHRCMRCDEEFTCRAAEYCQAQYDVLPMIVTLDEHGRPEITDHCPHLVSPYPETPSDRNE